MAYRSRWMDSDLDAFRDLVRSFLEKEVKPNNERFEQNKQVDRELWNKAGKVGLLCASIPEVYGGGGGTFAHEAVIIEEQARIHDGAWGISLHNGIVAHYVLAYGTEEQKRSWLPKLASGEWVGAIAMTEPGTGSDLQGVRTKAIRQGDEYVVTGSKTFITNGAQADLIITVVKTDPEEGAAGISLIAVEAERDGFRRGKILDKIGLKGQDTSELYYDDVRVPVRNLLGSEEGQGFIQLMEQLPQERLLVAIMSMVAMEVALKETLEYTRSREAFGRPIFAFQNTKFKLAEVATTARVGRSFVDECIELHIKGELDIPTVAMAKYWTSEAAQEAVDKCLQLFGGYGFMNEYPIARMWASLRVNQIYAGTTEIMKDIISRFL